MRGRWRQWAEEHQSTALAALPADATLKEKSDAICDAWPAHRVGERKNWPYTMWRIVRREKLGLQRIKLGEARKREKKVKNALKKSGFVQGRMFGKPEGKGEIC